MTIILLLGSVFWLPGYHQKFSVFEADAIIKQRPADMPVVSYPHSWNALDFLGPRVPSFGPDERPQLIEQLRSHPVSLIVVQNGEHRNSVINSFPPEITIQDERKLGLVTVITVIVKK
jgi:hypothetical protein